jgi:multiple sugar transport system substrate-binding protein
MNPFSRLSRVALAILAGFWLGCGPAGEVPSRETLTYTLDPPTRDLISLLAQKDEAGLYKDFDRYFKGLLVPGPLLPYEPFVLGLSTASKIPAVLLLDAPWVQRYGNDGWLYELERSQVFVKAELAPAVAEAFTVSSPQVRGGGPRELMAVPTNIKGNILFYRQDLLARYQLAPPRTWDDLKAICRKILPQERGLKYGLIFHTTNFVNDFYPIFWGFGGRILDEDKRLVGHKPENVAAGLAALTELLSLQGTVVPSAKDLKQFEAPLSVRRAFFQGEALFMINWNTRIYDLKGMISKGEGGLGHLTRMSQIGVAPIPCRAGHPHRYSNIGSFGWGVNRFAVTNPRVIERARRFISLVSSEDFQILAAQNFGQVPALKSALEKVTNPEVLQVYREAFAAPDMVLRPRPHSRRVNNVLEKYLVETLYGLRTPQNAMETVMNELQAGGSH